MQHARLAISLTILAMAGCAPPQPQEASGLDAMGTVDVQSKELVVHAWIADDADKRRKGLMFVTADEMAPLADGRRRGMLFVFERDQRNGFWMKDTIIDLDIAFIDENGEIVDTFTMAALDLRSYVPREAYRYALEVNAGVLSGHGIGRGDTVHIPETVLNRAP